MAAPTAAPAHRSRTADRVSKTIAMRAPASRHELRRVMGDPSSSVADGIDPSAGVSDPGPPLRPAGVLPPALLLG